MEPILTEPRQELEILVNAQGRKAARETIKAIMWYPVVARECKPYLDDINNRNYEYPYVQMRR